MTLLCPECESTEVLVREVSSFWVNSGRFFCHSVKAYDSDADTICFDCGWTGEREQLKDGSHD